MEKKKTTKTKVELVTEEVNKVLKDTNCDLWAVPKLVPFRKEGGQIVWEIHTSISVLEIKNEQKVEPKKDGDSVG